MSAPALQKANSFVLNGLAQGSWNDGDRLPSIIELARQCGVARATMWKAIHQLGKQGKVTIRHGAGVVAGKPSSQSHSATPSASGHSYEAKRVLLEQDILAGIFVPGRALPTMSELQARYGVSYRTMSKILNELAADRILISSRKKYFLQHKGTTKRGSVCLLWEGLAYGKTPRLPREESIIAAFQRECALAKTPLLFQSFELDKPSMAKGLQLRAAKQDSVEGYAIRASSLREPSTRARYVDLMMGLALEKKPVAFLDESGEFSLPQPLSANRLIKVFSISDWSAGRDIGRLLLSQGHRRAAFISFHQEQSWAVKRYEGVKFEFSKAGYSNAVSLHTMEYPTEFLDMLLDPKDLTREQMNRIFPGRLNASPDTVGFTKRFASLDPIIQSNMKMLKRFRQIIRNLADLSRRELYGDTLNVMIERSIVFMRGDIFRLFLAPLFRRALSDRLCTAWIGATDETAGFALDFLRDSKIKVPQDISLVGFDGDLLGFEKGLTSFDFDFPNIARQMLSFIFHPMTPTSFTKGNRVEMSGFIVHRSSTGIRPKSGP